MKQLIAPKQKLSSIAVALALAGMAAVPFAARAAENPVCAGEGVPYNPGNGEDVVLPVGFKIEVFARGLNFPTDVAFVGDKNNFKVLVLESGTGLPGRCNTNTLSLVQGAPRVFSPTNPFMPDILVFDKRGNKIAGPLGKPTPAGGGFQPDGPAIGLSFERDFKGGRLFATDSNQGARGAPGSGNNTSRVLEVKLNNSMTSAQIQTLIPRLPTGDHPTEQIVVNDGWLYWSQGSATNSGVTGLDNGAGGNQHEIPCEDVTLSGNVFPPASDPAHPNVKPTSGYSNYGVTHPAGTVIPAFTGASSPGMCTGAILRARIRDLPMTEGQGGVVEAVAWGFRNPYGLRFSPNNHPLKGQLLVSENGEDERGGRPVANAPDRLAVARQDGNGRPEFHGWPDRFGFLDSTQSVFNPETAGDAAGTAVANQVKGKTVRHVLAFLPRTPVAPLALEPEDVAAVGLDFVPDSFVGGIVKKNAVLLSREGDFGFSSANGNPEAGHDVEVVNFTKADNPNELTLTRFAFNCPGPGTPADKGGNQQFHDPDGAPQCKGETEQAFVNGLRGINRPTTIRFGPDGAAYLVDYGAVRDPGGSDPGSKFKNPDDAPLVQIPGTGTIWKISRVDDGKGNGHHNEDDDD